MAMFDWTDEELTNIIWDKARESDDRIVPYPKPKEKKHPDLHGDAMKQEVNQETTYATPTETKRPATYAENNAELVTGSKYGFLNSLMGFGPNSWPDRTDASVINVNPGQSSLGTVLANSITSSKDGTGQFNKDSDFFQNLPDDREQGDFVDYDWANIGSFDDLDRIFSGNRPIFGDMSVGNLDEPWSSSKDVTSSSTSRITPSGDSYDFPPRARTLSDKSDVKSECILDSSQSFISAHQIISKVSSQEQKDVQNVEMDEKSRACHEKYDDENDTTLNEFQEKGNKQKRLLKGKKLKEKSKGKQLQEIGSTWSSSGNSFFQVSNQYSASITNPSPPSLLSHQIQFQSAKPFQEKQLTYPPFSSHLYGNMVYHYPSMSALPQLHPMECNHKLEKPNSLNKSVDATVKLPTMTPKEKIEKLRRRQQLRAILAIQKQQQQLGNRMSVVENSTVEGDRTEVDESLGSFPSLDPCTSTEVDDQNILPFENCLAEESALYQLQDTISKLDNRIRFCIRDSLFRLAQSAIQRQCPSTTSGVNTNGRDEFVGDKNANMHERFTRIPDVETDTNPIDRTVAHLLFHRPLELSPKLADTPNSPVSAILSCNRKGNTIKSAAKGHFHDCFENTNAASPQGSKTSAAYVEKAPPKNSSCLDTIDNT